MKCRGFMASDLRLSKMNMARTVAILCSIRHFSDPALQDFLKKTDE